MQCDECLLSHSLKMSFFLLSFRTPQNLGGNRVFAALGLPQVHPLCMCPFLLCSLAVSVF